MGTQSHSPRTANPSGFPICRGEVVCLDVPTSKCMGEYIKPVPLIRTAVTFARLFPGLAAAKRDFSGSGRMPQESAPTSAGSAALKSQNKKSRDARSRATYTTFDKAMTEFLQVGDTHDHLIVTREKAFSKLRLAKVSHFVFVTRAVAWPTASTTVIRK
jgi:hypothetical protein